MNITKQMVRLSGLGLLLVAGALLSGCASTDTTGKNRAVQIRGKEAPQIQMPAPGKSKVVFARMGKLAWAVKFAVHDDDKLIGVLNANTYFVYECDPGNHLFSTSMENVAALDANLLPDHIYYVKVAAEMGWWIAEVKMYSLHPGCAGNLWPKLPRMLRPLRETVASSEAMEKDRRGAANYWERIQQYHQDKYLPNPNREQILPEHGQLQPIGGR